MDAAKPEKYDKECAEVIREYLSGNREGRRLMVKVPLCWYILYYTLVKVPLCWYILYYTLVEVSEGLGKKLLSREQCGKVAESIKNQ